MAKNRISNRPNRIRIVWLHIISIAFIHNKLAINWQFSLDLLHNLDSFGFVSCLRLHYFRFVVSTLETCYISCKLSECVCVPVITIDVIFLFLRFLCSLASSLPLHASHTSNRTWTSKNTNKSPYVEHIKHSKKKTISLLRYYVSYSRTMNKKKQQPAK